MTFRPTLFIKTPPPGVTQRIDLPGGGSYPAAVQKPNWKRFCYRADADKLLAALQERFPEMSFTMAEDGEEMARYTFADDAAPRIFLITGNNGASTALFIDDAGEILYRTVFPEGEDENQPYRAGDNLQMNLDDRFGYAFFFWSK